MGAASSAGPKKAAFEVVTRADGDVKLQQVLEEHQLPAEQIAQLLKETDPMGRTLLDVAIKSQRVKTVIFLLNHGASVGVQATKNGWTPLHFAVMCKSDRKAVAMIAALLSHGADPLVRDTRGQNPLQMAQLLNRAVVLRDLESKVCDFSGAVAVESFSSAQMRTGHFLGDDVRNSLHQYFGSKWPMRHVSICRLRGSRKMARFPRLKCPRCLKEQEKTLTARPYVTCSCSQVLIVPPRQRTMFNCLTIYGDRNCTVPDVAYDLADCRCELEEDPKRGLSVIRITLMPEAAEYVDPVYLSRNRIVDIFRHSQTRFAVQGRTVLRLGSEDRGRIERIFQILQRRVRTCPEPDTDLETCERGSMLGPPPQSLQGVGHAVQAANRLGNLDVAATADTTDTDMDNIPLAVAIAEDAVFVTPSAQLESEGERAGEISSQKGDPSISADDGEAAPPLPPRRSRFDAESARDTTPSAPPESTLTAADSAKESGSSSSSSPSSSATPGASSGVSATMTRSAADPRGYVHAAATSWVCAGCGLENPSKFENCQVCSGERPSPAAEVASALAQDAAGSRGREKATAPREQDIDDALLSEVKQESIRAAAERLSEDIDAFICPITSRIMADPVVTADGYAYERTAIEDWFKEGKTTSPVTGEELEHTHLVTNINLRNAIEQFVQKAFGAPKSAAPGEAASGAASGDADVRNEEAPVDEAVAAAS